MGTAGTGGADRWERFVQHASPEAIEHQLELARGRARRAARHVTRLEQLLAQRRAQVDRGEWPAGNLAETGGETETV